MPHSEVKINSGENTTIEKLNKRKVRNKEEKELKEENDSNIISDITVCKRTFWTSVQYKKRQIKGKP